MKNLKTIALFILVFTFSTRYMYACGLIGITRFSGEECLSLYPNTNGYYNTCQVYTDLNSTCENCNVAKSECSSSGGKVELYHCDNYTEARTYCTGPGPSCDNVTNLTWSTPSTDNANAVINQSFPISGSYRTFGWNYSNLSRIELYVNDKLDTKFAAECNDNPDKCRSNSSFQTWSNYWIPKALGNYKLKPVITSNSTNSVFSSFFCPYPERTVTVVAASADLSVDQVNPSSIQVSSGDQKEIDVIVKNLGPQVAKDVKLSYSPSGGFFSNVVFNGNIGDLVSAESGASGSTQATVKFKANFNGDGVITFSVSSTTGDPNSSNNSKTLNVEVLAKPSKPTLSVVGPSCTTNLQPTWSWTLPTGDVTDYKLYRSWTGDVYDCSKLTSSTNGCSVSGRTFTPINPLPLAATNFGSFKLQVAGFNQANIGDISNESVVGIDKAAPNNPNLTAACSGGKISVNLSGASDLGCAGLASAPYMVQLANTPAQNQTGGFTNLVTSPDWNNDWVSGTSQISSTNSSLFSSGKTFYLHVRTLDALNNTSQWSTTSAVTCTSNTCDADQNPPTVNSAVLSCERVGETDTFKVALNYYATDNGCAGLDPLPYSSTLTTGAYLGTPVAGWNEGWVSSLSQTTAGSLPAGTTVYGKVRARDSKGNISGYSQTSLVLNAANCSGNLSADLGVTLGSPTRSGNVFSLNGLITNAGPNSASLVKGTFNVDLKGNSNVTTSYGSGCNSSGVCDLGTLAKDASNSRTVNLTYAGSSSIVVRVCYSATSATPDPSAQNNSACKDITLSPSSGNADLQSDLGSNGKDKYNYDLTGVIKNNGPDKAMDVSGTYTVTCLSSGCKDSYYSINTPTCGSSKVCSFGDLNNSSSVSAVAKFTFLEKSNSVKVRVCFAATSTTSDPTPANNTSCVTLSSDGGGGNDISGSGGWFATYLSGVMAGGYVPGSSSVSILNTAIPSSTSPLNFLSRVVQKSGSNTAGILIGNGSVLSRIGNNPDKNTSDYRVSGTGNFDGAVSGIPSINVSESCVSPFDNLEVGKVYVYNASCISEALSSKSSIKDKFTFNSDTKSGIAIIYAKGNSKDSDGVLVNGYLYTNNTNQRIILVSEKGFTFDEKIGYPSSDNNNNIIAADPKFKAALVSLDGITFPYISGKDKYYHVGEGPVISKNSISFYRSFKDDPRPSEYFIFNPFYAGWLSKHTFDFIGKNKVVPGIYGVNIRWRYNE